MSMDMEPSRTLSRMDTMRLCRYLRGTRDGKAPSAPLASCKTVSFVYCEAQVTFIPNSNSFAAKAICHGHLERPQQNAAPRRPVAPYSALPGPLLFVWYGPGR